ncbi:MAG: hypothetical protein GWP91_19960 [Rhodobacterales bacterium]|nr:hypothetical protein [Rhodobacterales bacterium]
MRLSLTLILVLACGGDTAPTDSAASTASTIDPLSWPVNASGAFNVGYQTWEVTYEPLAGESRTVALNVWYPTDDTEGSAANYLGIAPDDQVFVDATPASPAYDQGYPVHAHSHGHMGWGATSANTARYFASHGWLYVSPNHTENTLLDNVDPAPQGAFYHRPLDVRAVIDAIQDLPADHVLAGLADTSKVLITGHSRGVPTVWSLMGADFDPAKSEDYCAGCSADQLALFESGVQETRAVAAITLDGGFPSDWMTADGQDSVSVPLMDMSAEEGHTTHQDQWDRFTGLDYSWLEVVDACHQTFALGGCTELSDEEGFHMVNTYALALGRSAVLNDTDDQVLGLLDGSVTVDSRGLFLTR